MISQLVMVAGFAVVAACNSYNPELPDEPFLCTAPTGGGGDAGATTGAGQCPDGYVCADGGAGRFVCVKPNAVVTDAGIDASTCDDDHNLEPNNDTSHAYQTMIDQGTLSIPYSGLSICPMGDIDVYSVVLTKGVSNSEDLDVKIEYGNAEDGGGAVLQAAILGSGGQTLANATPMGTNTIHAFIANLPNGQYYVKVFGPTSGTAVTNNYKMTITTTP